MEATVTYADGSLVIVLTGVAKADYSRVVSIELALLRRYGWHRNEPWVYENDKATVRMNRPRSTEEHAEIAREVLRGFAFEV